MFLPLCPVRTCGRFGRGRYRSPDRSQQPLVGGLQRGPEGGFGHLLMRAQGGTISHEDTVDNLTLFSREVLPRLKDLG